MGGSSAEHDRVGFISYPYEWPAEMLHSAGQLTLEIADALLSEDLGLKDASPFNILFRGTTPVFVDVLSVERREPRDPLWLAEAQFQRTFLLPLIANHECGLKLSDVFLSRRDGLEPEEVLRFLSPLQRLKPGVLGPVTAAAWLSGRGTDQPSTYRPRLVQSPSKDRFILRSTYRRLWRYLSRWSPSAGESRWTQYVSTAAGADVKVEFVRESLSELEPKWVLDVGCNTGTFSRIAARAGASVVAIDRDPAVVSHVWRANGDERRSILPLVVDVARPSPGTGWRNDECASFLDRSFGVFDVVMMLAIVHHLTIGERIPIAEVAALARDLTRDALLIEWVGSGDPMSRSISRGRDEVTPHLTQEVFEAAFAAAFSVVRSVQTARERRLYLMRRKTVK